MRRKRRRTDRKTTKYWKLGGEGSNIICYHIDSLLVEASKANSAFGPLLVSAGRWTSTCQNHRGVCEKNVPRRKFPKIAEIRKSWNFQTESVDIRTCWKRISIKKSEMFTTLLWGRRFFLNTGSPPKLGRLMVSAGRSRRHTSTLTHIHKYIHACIQAYIGSCRYAYKRIHIHTCTYTHTHTHTHARAPTRVYANRCGGHAE